VTTRPISAGEALTTDDLTFKKPGTGIPANALNTVIGKRLLRDLPANTILQSTDLEAAAT
jgi:N,N'-diacetyllegionaminate synthase